MKKTVCLILAVCTLMSYLINASAFYTPVDINNVDFISQSQKANEVIANQIIDIDGNSLPNLSSHQLMANYLQICQELYPTDDVERFALAFMRYSSENSNLQIRETTPMYDLDGNITSYCVSFQQNNLPSGYVVINLLDLTSPISEFSFWGDSPVDLIADKTLSTMATNSIGNNGRILYFGSPFYFVQTSSTELTAYPQEEVVSKANVEEYYFETVLPKAIQPMNEVDFEDLIVEIEDEGIRRSDMVLADDDVWNHPDMAWTIDDFLSGNYCAPTAATNIVWYWIHVGGVSWLEPTSGTYKEKATAIFNDFRGYMLSTDIWGSPDIFTTSSYLYYFQDYAGEDHKWDFSIASISSPTFSKIADRIDIGDVIHTCLRNENLFSMGHDVMTFGYAENNSGDEYLLIFDGWVENGRCILYDSIPVVKAIRVSAEN